MHASKTSALTVGHYTFVQFVQKLLRRRRDLMRSQTLEDVYHYGELALTRDALKTVQKVSSSAESVNF